MYLPVCLLAKQPSVTFPTFNPDIARETVILGEESDLALLQALQCRNVLQGRQIVASKVQQLHVLQQEVDAWQDVAQVAE